MSIDRIINKYRLKILWKEAVVAEFEVLSRCLRGRIEGGAKILSHDNRTKDLKPGYVRCVVGWNKRRDSKTVTSRRICRNKWRNENGDMSKSEWEFTVWGRGMRITPHYVELFATRASDLCGVCLRWARTWRDVSDLTTKQKKDVWWISLTCHCYARHCTRCSTTSLSLISEENLFLQYVGVLISLWRFLFTIFLFAAQKKNNFSWLG
jgi:hypothetical protein